MPGIDCRKLLITMLSLLYSLHAASEQTLIESEREENKDTQYTYVKEQADTQSSGDASMLLNIPGVNLTQSGGPLSHTDLRYRGLSGSRLKIDLEGLSLDNPLLGINDANAMFLFAAQEFHARAQSLSISLPKVEQPFAKGLLGYGSQHSFKLGASAGAPLGHYSSILAASQFSGTQGNFSYRNKEEKSGAENIFYRANNDQNRYEALINFKHEQPSQKANILAAFTAHEGGLAGFAFSPNKNLRAQTSYAGLSMGYSKKINRSEIKLNLANSLFKYRTTDIPTHEEEHMSSRHELSLGFNILGLPSWLEFELGEILALEKAYEQNHTRIGGGFYMKRSMQLAGRLKPRISAYFEMMGYEKHGLLFKKDLALTLQPSENISLTGGFTRSQRLPTFMELYANNKFFVGNEELNKESIIDIQLGTNIRLGNHTRLQVVGFLGFLSDVIVNMPYMATMVRPMNIKKASRYGCDFGATLEPLSWLLMETKNSLLKTKVAETNAPLPQAPAFLGLTRMRFGPPDLIALSLQSRYKTSSAANYYGTKGADGYVIFDALVSAPFKFFTLSLSVNNILNNKNARDTYEMPLPGILFFGQIEVGNS